jgi:hypothetical protein
VEGKQFFYKTIDYLSCKGKKILVSLEGMLPSGTPPSQRVGHFAKWTADSLTIISFFFSLHDTIFSVYHGKQAALSGEVFFSFLNYIKSSLGFVSFTRRHQALKTIVLQNCTNLTLNMNCIQFKSF